MMSNPVSTRAERVAARAKRSEITPRTDHAATAAVTFEVGPHNDARAEALNESVAKEMGMPVRVLDDATLQGMATEPQVCFLVLPRAPACARLNPCLSSF